MKVAIIGCSHSAGVMGKRAVRLPYLKRDKARQNLDPSKGWTHELAKKYPQHEFYVFANAGYGYHLAELAFKKIFLMDCDIVIHQETTPREFVPLCSTETLFQSTTTGNHTRCWFNNHGIHVKHVRVRDNRKGKSYTATKPSCCFKCDPSDPPRPKLTMMSLELDKFIDDQDINVDELKNNLYTVKDKVITYEPKNCGAVIGNSKLGLVNNENFLDMYVSHLRTIKIYKKLFKHYYRFETICDRGVPISASGDFPKKIYDMIVDEWDNLYDWDFSMFEWRVKNIMINNDVNKEMAKNILRGEWFVHGGHLGEASQKKMVDDYILKNEKLYNALEKG